MRVQRPGNAAKLSGTLLILSPDNCFNTVFITGVKFGMLFDAATCGICTESTGGIAVELPTGRS